MKKTLLIVYILLNFYCLMSQNIEQAFMGIPEEYFPQLNKEKRSELLYRYNVLKIDTISNNFKGISTIKELDYYNQFLSIKLTEISNFEEKIWTKSDSSKIIGFNHTVCGPVCDSHVAFFNSSFQRIDIEETTVFPKLGITDFLNTEKIVADGKTIKEIVNQYDILFTTIFFQKTSNNIILESTTEKYLNPEIYAEIKPYLLGNKIELIWIDGTFKKGNVTW